jgi:Ca2+-binding EF-hand superfamily protein
VSLLGILLGGALLQAAEPESSPGPPVVQPRRVEQILQANVTAAVGQVIVNRPASQTWTVREEVDRNNSLERFLLLLPEGPVIVSVDISIDGNPYQIRRETLIDELLAAADANGDTRIEWDEALQSARFTLGRVQFGNDRQRQQYRESLDANADGLVDRVEVRRFVAMNSQGPAFVVGQQGMGATAWRGGGGAIFVANGQVVSGAGTANATALLDLDKDGSLSASEILQAPELLIARDADDNDLLYPAELTTTPATASGNAGFVRSVVQNPESARQTIVLLGPEVPAESILQALQSVYVVTARGEFGSPDADAAPALLKRIDANGNSLLEPDELLTLNTLPADIELVARLGEPQTEAGVAVLQVADTLPAAVEAADAVRLGFSGVDLQIDTRAPPGVAFDYSQTGKQLITQYDKDANGYLETSEVPQQLVQQFDGWDDDGDGKVYAEEIVASYNRMLAPQLSQVRANLATSGDPLFGLLDRSGDGRLSLREMKSAAERILALDSDGDGAVSSIEVPETWTLSFGLGNTYPGMYRVQQVTSAVPNTRNAPNTSVAPEWFIRMDRNGDGDLTLREFLGGREKFDELDANHDGFIEPAEAAPSATEDVPADSDRGQ